MSLKHTDEQNFEKDVQQSQGLVLVDFWAEWCMPCKGLMQILESIAQQNSDITIIKVNVDELTIANHLATVEWVKAELKKPIDKLFKAVPELKRCSDCPIA